MTIGERDNLTGNSLYSLNNCNKQFMSVDYQKQTQLNRTVRGMKFHF